MSAREISIKLYRTSPHPCGYYRDRTAQDLVIDPESRELGAIYPFALHAGYRRSGARIFQPDCEGCKACVSSRIVVNDFKPNRSQLRCLKRNAGLRVISEPSYCSDERLSLYQRYLGSRHAGGGMDGATAADFEQFLMARWCDTRMLCIRDGERLIACAITDLSTVGLSAVYTFFEPELSERSLGTFCILQQIEWARRLHLPHLYLGYWLEGHPKMDYKRNYQPLEALRHGSWVLQTAE